MGPERRVEFVDGLPPRPTRLWREDHTSLARFAMAAVSLAGGNTDRRFGVDVSVNGLMLSQPRGGGFYPWNQIRNVTAAPPPDLALLELDDGTSVLLPGGHIPRNAEDQETIARERVLLLQAALRASRDDR